MKLNEFLAKAGLTYAAFGQRGQWSDETVRQWAIGGRIPRPQHMARIIELTDGKVLPADFYPVTAATDAA